MRTTELERLWRLWRLEPGSVALLRRLVGALARAGQVEAARRVGLEAAARGALGGRRWRRR